MAKQPNKSQPEALTQRQRRVGEEVRALLSQSLLLGDFYSSTSPSIITITEVRMSVDLKHAFAYIMPLGGKGIEEAIELLNEIKPQLRTQLAKSLTLRSAPILHFEVDQTFEQVEKLETLLSSEKVAKDIGSPTSR